MAYVPREPDDDEEEQQPKAPTLGAASAPAPATTSFGSQAPQQTPQQQRGTGFTNLQSWLDAGKGRDKSITSAGSSALGAERQNFDAAATPLRNASYKPETFDNKSFFGPNSAYTSLWDSVRGDEKAKSRVQGMLDQDYKGPTSVNYNPGQSLWDADALSDSRTAASVLARPEAEAGRYGRGLRALDSVLFGADSESRKAMDQTGKDAAAFRQNVWDESDSLAKKAQGFKDTAAQARAGTRTALQDVQDRMLFDLDQQVADRQAKDAERQRSIDQGFAIDPITGKSVRMGGAYSRGAVAGGGATRENVVSDDQVRGFDQLNKWLGTPTVQKTGTYKPISTQINVDPNYKEPLPSRGSYDPRPGTVLEMLPGNQNDPSTPKGAYYKFYFDALNSGRLKNAAGAQAWREFFDEFQRQNPNVRIPTGEEADAYEKSPNNRWNKK